MQNKWRCCLLPVPFLFLFFLCDNVLSGNYKTHDIQRLEKENRLLEEELKVVAKPIPYLVLDINKKNIYLKIKGTVLKEFNIIGIEVFGNRHLNIAYKLIERKAMYSPKRTEIKPPQYKAGDGTSSTSQEPDTFDIEDMPSNYTLIFNKGLSLSVSPQYKDGFFLSFLNRLSISIKHIWNSSIVVWNYLKKTPFIRIHAVMNIDDARALYWSLPEKADFIVVKNI